eukprot:TRINITY_DN181_c0_g1_i2.p1 TRINITY_DN181_c0_g1~~TRINITY_DN181_c0_g1_i2.p1  ORF type:complete len:251 (+),score=56.89 TRINITY_DN181_c0_g1_i2:52-804(+)
MTGIGSGYDLSATTFSPDGRVFQVEYAGKAVDNSGTAIALRCKDGVVFGVEKLVVSKMLVEGSSKRIHSIAPHVGLASAGLMSDSRQIVNRARQEARNYKDFYADPVSVKTLSERIGSFVQVYTLYSHMRPFGTSVLVGGIDKKGPQLYMVEPSGIFWGYFGCAIGKGKQAAKTEIEKLKLTQLTCKEAINEVARIVYLIHDDVKDKEFELELSWVCPESNNQHQFVPVPVKEEAERLAKIALESKMTDD